MDRRAQRNVRRTSAICNPRDPSEARDIFAGVETYAYRDTVEAFTRAYPTKDERRRLREAQGRFVPIKRSFDHHGQRCGNRIVTNQPAPATLLALTDIQQSRNIAVHRFDVSCDFSGKTQEHNEKIFELLVRHLVMRFGRADYRSEVDGTVYWNTSKTRSGRQGEKELVLYRDKVSKITGQKCVHLELRIYGAQAIAATYRYLSRPAGPYDSISSTIWLISIPASEASRRSRMWRRVAEKWTLASTSNVAAIFRQPCQAQLGERASGFPDRKPG